MNSEEGGAQSWLTDGTVYEVADAAHYLRKFYPNVFTCALVLTEYGGEDRKTVVTWGDKNGVMDGGRGHYYVHGPGVLTHDEVVSLALTHGWRG